MSGFVSSGFSIGNKGYGNAMTRTAIMAVVGGTVSKLGGGKFANGAVTASFVHMFNSEADVKKIINETHDYVDRLVEMGYRLEGSGWVSGGLNNVSSSFGKDYLGCIDQSIGLINILDNIQFDDTWNFKINYPSPVHKNVMGTSSNINDPKLILDPWTNTIRKVK